MAKMKLSKDLTARLRKLRFQVQNMAAHPDYQPAHITKGISVLLRKEFEQAGLPLAEVAKSQKTFAATDVYDANALVRGAAEADKKLPEEKQSNKERGKAFNGTVRSCFIAAIWGNAKGDRLLRTRVVPRLEKGAMLNYIIQGEATNAYAVQDDIGETPYFDARILPNDLAEIIRFMIDPANRRQSE